MWRFLAVCLALPFLGMCNRPLASDLEEELHEKEASLSATPLPELGDVPQAVTEPTPSELGDVPLPVAADAATEPTPSELGAVPQAVTEPTPSELGDVPLPVAADAATEPTPSELGDVPQAVTEPTPSELGDVPLPVAAGAAIEPTPSELGDIPQAVTEPTPSELGDVPLPVAAGAATEPILPSSETADYAPDLPVAVAPAGGIDGSVPESAGQGKTGLRVLIFSDTHGTCTDGQWPGGNISPPKPHMEQFKESAAAKFIEGTEHNAHLIIFGGDSTTIPQTVDCTEENFEELSAFMDWFETVQPGTPKLLIAGNHDTCLDDTMVEGNEELKEKRRKLIEERMPKSNISFVGAAGAVSITTADEKVFQIILSGISEGRSPGANKFYEDTTFFNTPEKKEFTHQELTESGVVANGKMGINALVGAYQYCPPGAASSYVDCEDVYAKTTKMLTDAAALLGNQADLAVIHGPPDNIGFKFGKAVDQPGPMALALMDPLLRKNGRMMVGHYHPAGDWKEGHRTQQLKRSNAEPESVPMTFVPVKAGRPEVCDYESDGNHMPRVETFDGYEVDGKIQPAQIKVEHVTNTLTMDLLQKFIWPGPTFNQADPEMKYVLLKAASGENHVFIPKVLKPVDEKPNFMDRVGHHMNNLKKHMNFLGEQVKRAAGAVQNHLSGAGKNTVSADEEFPDNP